MKYRPPRTVNQTASTPCAGERRPAPPAGELEAAREASKRRSRQQRYGRGGGTGTTRRGAIHRSRQARRRIAHGSERVASVAAVAGDCWCKQLAACQIQLKNSLNQKDVHQVA